MTSLFRLYNSQSVVRGIGCSEENFGQEKIMGRGFGGRGGFGGLGDINKLMKQAQKMQDDMMVAQEELKSARIESTAGGGVIKAVVDGKGKLVNLEIKPEAVDPDDVEMLQDLIIAAI